MNIMVNKYPHSEIEKCSVGDGAVLRFAMT